MTLQVSYEKLTDAALPLPTGSSGRHLVPSMLCSPAAFILPMSLTVRDIRVAHPLHQKAERPIRHCAVTAAPRRALYWIAHGPLPQVSRTVVGLPRNAPIHTRRKGHRRKDQHMALMTTGPRLLLAANGLLMVLCTGMAVGGRFGPRDL